MRVGDQHVTTALSVAAPDPAEQVAEAERVVAALRDLGLLDADEEPVDLSPLTGGVSSAIWRVRLREREVCVKWALPKLRVAADWHAPVERNTYEVAWLELASRIVPGSVTTVLASDPERGLFVMPYLGELPVWKSELRDGRVDAGIAGSLGTMIASIHAATAGDDAVAARFDTVELFRALRIEPYLTTSADRNPRVADVLHALADDLAVARVALVHGDVSPKNVLVGTAGPVLLDAECAWYGDPAFDVAFCCSHLLLKCAWRPQHGAQYLGAYRAFTDAYLQGVTWEPSSSDVSGSEHPGDRELGVERSGGAVGLGPRRRWGAPDAEGRTPGARAPEKSVEERIAGLLPALLLARVDGSSPVEYVTSDDDRSRVRTFAIEGLLEPEGSLTSVAERWTERWDRRS